MKEYVFKNNKEIKGCGDCPLVAINKMYDYRDGKMHKHIYCCLNHNIRFPNGISDELENRRHSNCPLIELPEPHGRLTDADAFKAYCKKGLELIHGELSGIGLKIAVAVTNSFLKDIDEAPTILEASK